MGQFGADVMGRWATLEQANLSTLAVNPFVGTLVAIGLLVLVGLGFWYGRRAVRLGLIWTGLHLGFIYLGLWSQRRELFDGRYLYNAWIGVSLTVGAGLAQWAQSNRVGGRVGARPLSWLLPYYFSWGCTAGK